MKKYFSILLSVCMMLSLIPATAFAEQNTDFLAKATEKPFAASGFVGAEKATDSVVYLKEGKAYQLDAAKYDSTEEEVDPSWILHELKLDEGALSGLSYVKADEESRWEVKGFSFETSAETALVFGDSVANVSVFGVNVIVSLNPDNNVTIKAKKLVFEGDGIINIFAGDYGSGDGGNIEESNTGIFASRSFVVDGYGGMTITVGAGKANNISQAVLVQKRFYMESGCACFFSDGTTGQTTKKYPYACALAAVNTQGVETCMIYNGGKLILDAEGDGVLIAYSEIMPILNGEYEPVFTVCEIGESTDVAGGFSYDETTQCWTIVSKDGKKEAEFAMITDQVWIDIETVPEEGGKEVHPAEEYKLGTKIKTVSNVLLVGENYYEMEPAEGYTFSHWEGVPSSGIITEALAGDKAVRAVFTKKSGGGEESGGGSSSGTTRPVTTGTWGSPVTNGIWIQNANGSWNYTTNAQFKNTWGYIRNPYAKEGQAADGWFYFDAAGNMLTGWQYIGGYWYYLNPVSDGTLGMCYLNTTTPDGYKVDANGRWIP